MNGMAASATTDPAQSGDLPPDVRAALQRIRDGSRDPADHAVLRRALAAGQVQIVSGDRAVAVSASVNDAVIVTGDSNVITIIEPGMGAPRHRRRGSVAAGTPRPHRGRQPLRRIRPARRVVPRRHAQAV
ncbi:MAG: hypothetical protein NZM94_00330 [Roseiflexus sp.]|nr:hypothetical protein [Roseiflexus sp.]